MHQFSTTRRGLVAAPALAAVLLVAGGAAVVASAPAERPSAGATTAVPGAGVQLGPASKWERLPDGTDVRLR